MKSLIKQLLRENLNNEIQLYVDIIDTMDKSNPRRKEYIDILKNKFDYQYADGDDEYFINNPQ